MAHEASGHLTRPACARCSSPSASANAFAVQGLWRGPIAVRRPLSRLIPPSGHGTCLLEHLRQLVALLLGGTLTGDAVLVRPLVRICVPRREHLVVVAGDLGHRNRRCPAHAPATLADLIWSFHLTTRFPAWVGRRSMCRDPCLAQPYESLAFRGNEIVEARLPQRGRSLRSDGRGSLPPIQAIPLLGSNTRIISATKSVWIKRRRPSRGPRVRPETDRRRSARQS